MKPNARKRNVIYENRKISNKQRDSYARGEKNYAQEMINKYKGYLANIADSSSELTIIDIGGGSGHFSNCVKSFFEQKQVKANMFVIDYCQYEDWNLFSDITFIHESAFLALDRFADASVDIIFMNYFLHHLTTDSYHETLDLQKKLLEYAYKKIKTNGLVIISEMYVRNPIIKDFSVPIVYYMSSSKIPFLKKLSNKLGSQSAGIGVCFLSIKMWSKTFFRIGFKLVDKIETEWKWTRKYLIKDKFFDFILTK